MRASSQKPLPITNSKKTGEALSDTYTLYKNDYRIRFKVQERWDFTYYDWRHSFFFLFVDSLRDKGYVIKVREIDSFPVSTGNNAKKRVKIWDSAAVLRNDRTKQYHVIDCSDSAKFDDLEGFFQDTDCKKILKSQYNKRLHGDIGKIVPWTYFDRFWPEKEEQFLSFRRLPRKRRPLYFRGADWGFRKGILDELVRRKVTNPDYETVEFDEYIKEVSSHLIWLSLPGYADFCNRDVEGFACGACVLRPLLRNQFHDPIIPDHHYISVDIKDEDWHMDPAILADRFEKRYYEVVEDDQLLESVSKNAAKWYDENVSTKAIMTLTDKLLGLP